MDPSAPDKSPTLEDRAALERDLASFRTYLAYVAARFKGERLLGADRTSDLVQRTMVAVLEKVRDGNIPRSGEEQRKRWIRRILRNIWIDLLRKELRSPTIVSGVEQWLEDSSSSPSGKAMRAERLQSIQQAIDQLKPAEREVVAWRYRDNLSTTEIAKRLGCSDRYVRQILKSCRVKLRSHLSSADDSELPSGRDSSGLGLGPEGERS